MEADSLRSEPENGVMSIEEAAQVLGVTREFFLDLLRNGHIRCPAAGVHGWVMFNDVMVYRNRRDRQRHEVLNQMAKGAMQAGHYDDF